MKTCLALAIALLSLVTTSLASADSMGPCPEGEIVVGNPTTPGSMHHGGFHCEPDPSAPASGACSAGRGAEAGYPALALFVVLGVAVARRSSGR